MLAPLMLFICLAAIFTPCFTRIGSSPNANEITKVTSETSSLGKIIFLAKTDLLEDFKEKEASIFEPFPPKCFEEEPLNTTKSRFEYYSSTKEFYSKLATQSGLDVSLQSKFSLGLTLNVATQSISSENSSVNGISLIVEALTEKRLVQKDCLDDETYKFKKSFLTDLNRLPLKINEPWLKSSWQPYHVFFDKYGSHVVNSVQSGVMLKQMVFAKSSESYSERDYEVKSCVDLAGPTSVGLIGVNACSNVSKSESSKASEMSTSNKLILRGGSTETRSKLENSRSKEVIEKFLNEAPITPSSVVYTFRAVWKILQSRFPSGTPNYVRGVNMENYYLGYLNYGCPHIESTSGEVHIQKFDHTKGSKEENPEYECSLAKEGCHSNNDCHYKPIWCSCYGPSCVHYKAVEQDTGHKETAYANTADKDQYWGWEGCSWKAGLAGSYCMCYNHPRDVRRQVWFLPSRDAPEHKAARSHGAHRRRGKGSRSE
ncbi:hypothetical protein OS493_012229 [Desmophyllum pertusum]|uniref:MACPF domain-containing protein n=1 Tax=Desmophyllum pertusum TaxID=174260 RepID=A0A9X0DC20_9CNID|nr:hypothetical protein OS493_012229 [Desmophyllum pertusum]